MDEEKIEVEAVLGRLIHFNRKVFESAALKIGMQFYKVLTAEQAVNFRSLLSMPWTKFRSMVILLKRFGIKVFPSEKRMRF